ncbi:MAG: hypothetical protein GTN81_09465 [Proteobacteria bacterium]|nr:hypothetical protein [Pseudomonadota bacterium]
MNRVKKKLMGMFIFVFTLTCFYAFAGGAETEVWELQLTGDIKGTLKMKLERAQNERENYSITGKFSGKIHDYEAGLGRLSCKFKGKIEEGVFVASFTGYADLAVNVRVKGTMKGTVSRLEGSGSWSLKHSQGSRAGEWMIKKIKASQ